MGEGRGEIYVSMTLADMERGERQEQSRNRAGREGKKESRK